MSSVISSTGRRPALLIAGILLIATTLARGLLPARRRCWTRFVATMA